VIGERAGGPRIPPKSEKSSPKSRSGPSAYARHGGFRLKTLVVLGRTPETDQIFLSPLLLGFMGNFSCGDQSRFMSQKKTLSRPADHSLGKETRARVSGMEFFGPHIRSSSD